MAGTNPEKYSISPLGAFLVGLFLGAGVLFVYHAKSFSEMSKDLANARHDTQRLEKVQRELHNLIAGLEERVNHLESKNPAKAPASAPEKK
jgi:hypothetical protein